MKKEIIKKLFINEGVDEACRVIESEFCEISGRRIAFNIFMFFLGILLGALTFQFI